VQLISGDQHSRSGRIAETGATLLSYGLEVVGCTQAAGMERIQYVHKVFLKGRLCDFAQNAGTDVHLLHMQLYYNIIYLLTAIGWSPGGSTHLHTRTT